MGSPSTRCARSLRKVPAPAAIAVSRGAVQLLQGMRTIAQRQGLSHLVAPVRPSFKEHYPLTDIAKYVAWRREDGQLFDPWMRVHERLGARVSTPLPESLLITGTVADWESWTEMAFPEQTGDTCSRRDWPPCTSTVSRTGGTYWEPNVWLVHPDRPERPASHEAQPVTPTLASWRSVGHVRRGPRASARPGCRASSTT